jgi:Mrp family chromosome partitioning ATPase
LEEPLQLLESPAAQRLLDRLREQFEIIVLDTPPLLPIADSHVLSSLADGVVLVVRARQTPREILREALHSFHASNLLGVVLNGVDMQLSSHAYAYRYYASNYLAPAKERKAARL